MGEKLIKPYEISVWEDKLTQIEGSDPAEYKLTETKLAIIGSDTMTGLNKVYNPVFHKKSNGEKTLSFSLKYRYFDPYSGSSDVVNPFAALLVNERKIKLHYDGQWYEFIIKDHSESSDGLEWTYSCTDAFILELSKNGYNITFDSELNNNQGTAKELAQKTLENTDWQVSDGDPLVQLIAEPIYQATLVSTTNVEIINASQTQDTIPEPGSSIYLFYSYIKNKNGSNVQFIIRDENRQYIIDNKNVITDTNFRIKTDLVYDERNYPTSNDTIVKGFWLNNNPIISIGEIETKFQANRLAYNQLTTYDPIMERTVDRFQTTDGEVEIYRYTDYEYTTSNVVMNYITNGENFNALEDGTLQGWNPYTDQINDEKVNKLSLVTKPEIGTGKSLADINTLSQIEGFLKIEPNGPLTIEGNKIYNTVYNSGIENHTSFIESIAQGQKFVFRWRAGEGMDINDLEPKQTLGLIVAKYTQDEPTRYGYYYKHIDPKDIILRFEGTPAILDNIISGGTIETTEDNTQIYVINGVVQTPSTKYIYKVNDTSYLWDGTTGQFVEKTNESKYLPYYYLTAETTQAISNKVLTDPTEKIGIFIYATQTSTTTVIDEQTQESKTVIVPIYIQDIQLTRFVPDASGENIPVILGNIPVATSNSKEFYYIKPTNETKKEDIDTYITLSALKQDYGLDSEIIPLYNEGSEKNLTISVSQSNCFNILQTIAETFECWVDIVVEHDDEGYITEDDGKPNKYVYLRQYVGEENWAGFKYGINLDTIERTINSDEIVSKLIVDSSQSEYVDEGFISIMNAPSNQSGESYILNFDYYYSQGLLNREEAEIDRLKFITETSNFNNQLKEKEAERRDLESSLTALGGNRNFYTELIVTEQEKKNEALLEFEDLTGISYEDYQKKHGELIINNAGEGEGTEQGTEKQLTDEETIVDVIGELYASSATINNYAGILTNIEEEYQKVRKQLYGLETYYVQVSTVVDNNQVRHIIVELNDYLPGFSFRLEHDDTDYKSTVSIKYFDISLTNATTITFTAPRDYTIVTGAQTIDNAKTVTYEITPTISDEGLIGEIEKIREEKDELTNNFNNKYSRFIQEGTWNSTDYIDSELYYLDALQVSNTSAQPIVTYTINVVEVSRLEGLENYTFDTGDKTYVEDTEFFGWNKENIGTEQNPEFIYTPAREEVIVSEVEWHLDEPDQNIITVQNYKTRFEDLFQRISATVQTVQYNEATYAKTSSLIDAQGTLNQNVLLDSLNNISGQSYSLTSNGSVIIDGDRVLIRNLQNPANKVIINSEGIRISSDGGQNWQTAIDGQGINIGTVYTGTLNTNEVIIGSRDNPSFRWDKSGISAYKTNGTTIIEGQTVPKYDLQTYVRYDEYGLYGIKDNNTFKAQSLEDVLDKAHFAVTWDGFFIKNSYPQGGKVEITSDNDFRVLNTINNQLNEKIKIGALEWKQENWHEGDPIYTDPATIPESIKQLGPSLYGIRIKNNAGAEVMKTDDQGNIHITGDITATSGHIGGMVVNNDSLTMDTIVLEPGVGIYSTIQTDNNPAFIISDANGSATFNRITARGHIEAQTGTLGELEVIDTITVGAQGAIESSNWSTQNQTGWHIDDNGATFNNANVRGTITALQGDFLGEVRVGPTNQGQDHIIIDGTRAAIKSSNYQDGAGYGWMINKDGDAVFNNITARGAIKTAVFEYAEIQAVGGIFIFRPSSTIKAARINRNNLILKVEKPALFAKAIYSLSEDTAVDNFKTYYIKGTSGYIIVDTPTGNPHENGYYEMHTEFQSWCKISNYTTDGTEPNVNNILLSNGLTHVYKVLDVNLSTAEVTLENGIQFINAVIQQDETTADVLTGLEGGALVDMGREDGSSNYGIGINSSDNTVNLPRRAISLFETIIDPSKTLKVSYKYKGILGTLPALQYTGIDAQVSPLYHNYLEGTQGIYTDNMYLGDKEQYIAFYEDEDGNKQLKIKANEVVYEVVDEETGSVDWHNVTNIEDAVKTSHDANATAAIANSTANTANQTANTANNTANNANTKAEQAVTNVNNLQNKLKYYWVNEVAHTNGVSGWTKPNYPVGTYAASGINGTTFDSENSSTYGYNTWYANGINLRYNAIKLGELTGSSLTFYQPSTTAQGAKAMELSGSALKFYASNGTTVQAEFGGSKARVSGTINAYDGQIGNSEDNYWYIGNYLDYFENQSAIIKSHGTASIQLGDSNTWRIATNRIHTAWNNDSSSGDAFKLHFPVYDNKYWDSGLHLPTSANDKLLYIRNSSSSNTLTYLNEALEDQYTNRWNYLFYITNSGSIYAKNIYVLDDNGQATQIGGTDGVYLLKSGGTITGNLTVNGTLTGTLSGTATRVSKDLKIQLNGGTTEGTNQFTYNGSTAKTINITKSSVGLSNVENTALSTWAGSSNLTTTKVGTLAAAAVKGVDTSITASSTSTNLPTSKAVADLIKGYLPLTGGNVTGAVTFGSSVSADELTVGDLVVNGNASFTNNLQANTINGVAVGSSPKFTDTNYYHTTGSWGGTNNLTYTTTANGGAGALAFTLATATTGVYGVTKLSSATDSNSTTLAATASAVKAAYDLAASKTNNTGTVTSVRVQASSPLQSSSSTASSTILDTTISFANQNANTVLAGPTSGSTAAAPTFRKLVAADIPDISGTYYLASNPSGYTTNTGTVTKVIAGTGLAIGTTAQGNFTTSGTINHTNSVTAKTAAAQSAKTLTFGDTFTLYEEKYDAQGHITGVASYNMTMPANPNTHYTANLIIGASATAQANAAASTNGNVYLNLVENSTVRNYHNIVGSGTVTVTSDANGKITISGSAHPTSLKNPNAITLNLFNETAARSGSTAQNTPTSFVTYDGSTANQSFSAAGRNAITSIGISGDTLSWVRADGSSGSSTVTITASVASGATVLTDTNGNAISTTGNTTPVWFDSGVPKDVTSIAFSLLPTGTGNNQVAVGNHTHGNITSGGDITATAPTVANGDQIIINDHSASKITNGPTFDGSTTTQYLTKAGTWGTPIGTTYSAGTGLSLSNGEFSIKLGYTTSGNNRKVQADSSGNLYVVQTDTTYTAGSGLSLSGTTFSNSGVTGVKGSAESSYRTGNVNVTADNVGAVPINGALLTTNPFISDKLKRLYISKIDNAFYCADKRWNVTCTVNGSPYTSVSQFFDGNYEGNNQLLKNGATGIITMDFTGSSGTGHFPGYPYGYIYVSFYSVARPASISARMYCDYQAHGIGWHDLTCEQVESNLYRIRQPYYNMQTLEITIVGDTTNSYGYTSPCEIEMYLDRPDPSNTPYLTKYTAQTLYYALTAPKFIGDLQGNADTATKATNDVDGNPIKTTYAKLSGATFTGAINTANGTYNKIGDDVQIGDINVAGTLGIKGINGRTGIRLVAYSGSTNTDIYNDGAGNLTITGTVLSTFSGNLTGNVTGNVTGTASGNVTSVQYDSTNTKFTYTKNGSNTDIVTIANLKTYLGLKALAYKDSLGKSDVGLGNVDNTADANKRVKGANITTTANAVAYYTDTTGTFGSKASANGALYATAANGTLNWGTLPVAQGGTGATTFTSGAALIGNGTNAVQTRSITNVTNGAVTANTNLVTANSLVAHVANKIAAANDTYVTLGSGTDNRQTIKAQKTFEEAIRWSVTSSTTGSKYGACNYDSTLDALVFSFGTI